MAEQEAGEVDQETFLTLVRRKLAELELPANPKEMDDFAESDGASGLREELVGGVTEQTAGAQEAIRGAAEEEPTPAEAREPESLPEHTPPATPDLRAEEAAPVARSDEQVMQPLLENQQAVEARLETAKADEERVERLRDPSYVEIQESQAELDAHVENASQAYRQHEGALIEGEESAAISQEAGTRQSMEQARTGSDTDQAAAQQVAMTEEERVRQEIADHVEGLYTATQEAVQEKLDTLDEEVDRRFTQGEERAREIFEDYVDDEMWDWRWERYGQTALVPVVGTAIAAGTWLHDQWVGISNFPEIIEIFNEGRRRYLEALDDVIVDIAAHVEETLAWCQGRIEQGEEEIRQYVESLPEAQREIGDAAADDIFSRFDELRSTVENQRETLANRLAERYHESRQALDAEIAEFHEANSGLREDFEDLVESFVSAIEDLENLLPSLARHIPGYTLATVVIGFNPLTGEDVDRNAFTLLEGLMGLVPAGTFIFDALNERGVLQEAFTWVEGELSRLNLSTERIEETIDAAWEDIQVAAGVQYNIDVLVRHFGSLLSDVTEFALSLVDYLIDLIKRTALDILEDLLAENQAWELIKKVLHHDPLRDLPVDASTAEIIEDFLLLIGKEQELEAMREQGTIDETAEWIDTQLATFLSLADELGALFSDAWDAIQPENLPDLMASLESLVPRVGSFLERAWDFALTVAEKVLELIKDAVLEWMRTVSTDVPGYHLLTVILGQDVFTEEEVPRTPTNLIRGFMSLLPGGEEQFQQLQESGVIPDAAARIESAIEELGISWEFVQNLFRGIWDSLSIEDLLDPVGAFNRIVAEFGEPIGRLISFAIEVMKVIVELILRLMGFPFELVESIIANALQAVEDISNDPIRFFENMIAAMKSGFGNFFDNIVTHLVGGLADWLFGGLRDAGIEPPADLSLESILDFVLEALGLTIENLWEKLAERIGQENVDRIRGAIDRLIGIWNFVADVQERGMVAIWEYIESQISNLWDIVLEKAQEWIMERIIIRATQWLLSLLDVTGIMPVINACIAIFNAIQSFIQYLREILEIINDYVSTVAAIARGDIQPGAQKMERGLANAIPIVLGFLANQFGFGNIAEKIAEIIGGVREMIDEGIEWLLDQAMRLWDSMMGVLGFGGGEEEEEARAAEEHIAVEASFRAEEGSRHRIFISEGEAEELTIASQPTSYSQFVNGIDPGDDLEKQAAKTAAIGIVSEFYTVRARPYPEGISADERLRLLTLKRQELNAILTRLWVQTDIIFGDEGDIPTGESEAEAIPITWFKDLHNQRLYPPILIPDNEGHYEPHDIYSGFHRVDHPLRPGLSMRVGVDRGSYEVSVDDVLLRLPNQRGSMTDQYRYILELFNVADLDALDADHVKDLNFGGEDAFANIWMLDRAANRSAGARQNNQIVTYRDVTTNQVRSVAAGHPILIGKFFKIESVGF